MEPTDFAKGKGWLIRPESFEELARCYYDLTQETVLENGAEYQAFLKRQTQSKDFYKIRDGIAIIPINGPLSKRLSFFGWLVGGSTYSMISKAFKEAIDDPDVEGIVLSVDSPGGTVTGTESLAELIWNAKGKKPIVSFANGMMASSAYWIASAADAVVGESTADIGSIGVLMIHRDYSRADEKRGVKVTYLTAGKYKALGNDAQPLSAEAIEVFQSELDYIYSIFVNTIARNRDTETDIVLSEMADGRMFIGQQAVDVGLIDHVGNLETAVELARAGSDISTFNSRSKSKMSDKDKIIEITTTEQLAATYPELVIEIASDAEKRGKESVDLESVANEAKVKECDRILGLAEVQFGEEESYRFRAIVESGVTVEQFKAIQDQTSKSNEDDVKQKLLDGIENSGAENPGADANAVIEGQKDFMTLVAEYRTAKNCGVAEAMKMIAKTNPQAHTEYLKSVNPGKEDYLQ